MIKAVKIIFSLIFLVVIFGFLAGPHQPPQSSGGLHYASNSTQEFFEDAYKAVLTGKPVDKISGITVNHHLLAPNLIAQEFAIIATDKPVTVVLLSPNHFYRGDGGVISSTLDWQTPYGILETDKALIGKLTTAGLVNVDETPFEQEHGINNIVGFIKKSLPNAKFAPFIVKDNLPDDKTDELAAKLAQILPPDALMVGSLDFSHYLPSNAADFHDTQTLATIHNFDYDRIKNLDIDSHPGLRLLLKYFSERGDRRFVLTNHSNSSKVTGNFSFVETTSYIDGYFTAGVNEQDSTRTVLYVQGLGPQDHWATNTSERLYKFNDQVVTQRPPELDALNLGNQPIAVGLVYDLGLTRKYLFPLTIANHLITLLAEPKPDTLMTEIKSASPAGR